MADVVCSVISDKGTFINAQWETFELTQWPSLNYFVYSVGLHQI